ncbi:FACT complex subunit, partial [Nowakowskiella sp. JEL0078]
MSVRGWNWGAMDMISSNLSFSVGGKPVFEIPVDEIASINGQNKDVNIDIKERSQITPSIPGQKRKPRDDVLVQMQLYVPGMEGDDIEIDDEDLDEEAKILKTEKNKQGEKEDGEIEDVDNEEGKITAAASFANRLKRAANLGTNAGEELSKFQKIMCLTPRGRFDLIIYPSYMRMVGTSHDITIQFKNIKSLFLLPRPDLIYYTIVVSLQPPLRQGNTKYPFLVFHFEEAEHSLTLDEKLINQKCPGKLQAAYDGLLHEVFSDVLSGLTEKEILLPSEKYRSDHEKNTGIKCSYKAAEAFLYPLDSGFVSIPKPTMFFKHSEINKVTFSRIGGQTTRTMEIKIDVSGVEYVFGNMPREEHSYLQAYCRQMKIKIENELEEVSTAIYDLGDDVDIESEDEGKRKRDPDEDDEDESEDEDFVAEDSGSDVPEEFNAKYKGDDTDEEGNT